MFFGRFLFKILFFILIYITHINERILLLITAILVNVFLFKEKKETSRNSNFIIALKYFCVPSIRLIAVNR